jgi:hypothetical protein
MSAALGLAFFYVTFGALTLTLLIAIALHPRGRLQWGTVGLIVAFLLVLVRTLIQWHLNIVTIPQPWGTLLWAACVVLVVGYTATLIAEWAPFVVERACAIWAILCRPFQRKRERD